MAEEKNSIIVYADWIDKFEELSDEEAGRLIKHFFRYVNDLDPVAPDRITKLSFIDIEKSLKRDLKKWDAIKIKRSEAGKASAEAKRLAKEAEQTQTKSTSVESVDLSSTKSTVSVNVNDTVNVNVNGSVNEINNKKENFAFDPEFEEKKSELIDLLVDVWGFSEQKYSQQKSMVFAFVTTQLKSIEDINHFAEQYKNYDEYKKLSGEQRHNSTGYFGTQAMKFSNGAWNSENWRLKLEQYQSNNKKSTKFDKLADAYNTPNPYLTNE